MDPMQSPPNSFLAFSSWFYQDIRHNYPSFDAAVSAYPVRPNSQFNPAKSAFLPTSPVAVGGQERVAAQMMQNQHRQTPTSFSSRTSLAVDIPR